MKVEIETDKTETVQRLQGKSNSGSIGLIANALIR